MASSTNGGGSLPPNFLLTPHQQSLLFAALNANKQPSSSSPAAKLLSLSPSSFQSSPIQSLDGMGARDSPSLDNYDYEFGDSSFDFSFASTAGDQGQAGDEMSATTGLDSTANDAHEKRSHPDDDDADSPGNDSKRRESTDKIAKKPGRKPLTSEPTTKRKAQNRAAQRAFRERKEKHLKDLETKVEELEKASEEANHENTKLRAQVDQMTTELNQYKQRLTVMSTHNKPASSQRDLFNGSALNNLGDVSFQFEFPKFGSLPGPPMAKQPASQPISPQQNGQKHSPARSLNRESSTPHTNGQQSHQDDLSKFAGMFPYNMGASTRTASRASVDSIPFSVAAATSSPSASSSSNTGGPNSSCGTSPEPFTQSPMGSKPLETLTTIGEEQPASAVTNQPFSQFPNIDIGSPSFDWLVQQNGGGSFDPQLFGDYREPQENILSNPTFDDFFFNDGLDADFITPFNTAPTEPVPPKKSLIAQIDAQQNADDDVDHKKPMNCNKLWEKLQGCPKAQSGEFDLDGLCSELTKKAKCSGSGPVVGETDFDSILKKYMGKDVQTGDMASKLGIAVTADKPNGVTKP